MQMDRLDTMFKWFDRAWTLGCALFLILLLMLLFRPAHSQVDGGYGNTTGYAVSVCASPPNAYNPSTTTQNRPAPFAVDALGRLCVNVYTVNPLSPMQSQLSVTTGATVALTLPTGATYATISLRQGAASCINYTTDGTTTPTTGATGTGRQLCAGQSIAYYTQAFLTNFKAIAATATTAIDVEYGQ